MFDIDPVCIAMQIRDATGQSYTSYWNCSQDDRAILEDALRQDGLFEWVRNNRDSIIEILNREEDEADGQEETDTSADSEG